MGMKQEIIINIEPKETRCAFLKNGLLHDLIIERDSHQPLTGKIYYGVVKNTLPNIRSAFIDIGENENGFIHDSDILENSQKLQEMFDMDFDFAVEGKGAKKAQETDIAKLLRPGHPVLVQVVKEPSGSKGARLTSNVSIAGRYLVLVPSAPLRGVSRKIEDRATRERLKQLIEAFELPQEMGLICRTASVNATEEQLIGEAHDLINTWKTIVEKFEKAQRPTCLFEESGLIERSAFTAIDHKYQRILVDDHKTFLRLKQIADRYGDGSLKVECYRDKAPIFERFGIEREIDKALRRKIWLPSGGYLFLDRTEAMLTVDVNSGKSKSKKLSSDVEESLVRINMEAAEEIARQLRIRNIGGLIICDFIDMRTKKNQKRVLERLKDAMKDDSAKCTVSGMSDFCLVEMTRQQHRTSLPRMMNTTCPYCAGCGMIKTHETTSIEIMRCLKKLIRQQEQFALRLTSHPSLNDFLEGDDKTKLVKMADKLNATLAFATDDSLHLNEFQFHSTLNGQLLDI